MITIRCTLLRDVFEGGQAQNPDNWEWPPSWMRLFSALVSVAEVGADDGLLRQLEEAPPPEIIASEAKGSHRESFVPLNAVAPTTHGTLVARTNGERAWARAIPLSRSIYFHWRSVELAESERSRLTSLCRRIPYLGRSTSPALIELTDLPELTTEKMLRPRTEGTSVLPTARVRCPFPGALEALRAAHHAKYEQGEPGYPWEIGITIDYGYEPPPAPPEAISGPYQQLVVYKLDGSRLDGRLTAKVTHAVRRAVMSLVPQQFPALHGHHAGDVTQCAFLGLVDVDHRHADGHLLGVGMAIPDLASDELNSLALALGAQLEVVAGPLGLLRLTRVSPLDAKLEAFGLDPARWRGSPSTVWATALPLVLDGHARNRAGMEREVRKAVDNAGYPRPELVEFDQSPFIEGGVRMLATDTLRRSDDQLRPFTHAVIHFSQPVVGPVVIGSMRHYGLGLCVPYAPSYP